MGIVTSMLPVEHLQPGSKSNQVIKTLFHTELSNQGIPESGSQGLFQANVQQYE